MELDQHDTDVVGKSNPHEVLTIVLKHMFGLNDHVIERIRQTISNAGQQADMQRKIRDIPANVLKQIEQNIQQIADMPDGASAELEIGDRLPPEKDHRDVEGKSQPMENMDFKDFLLSEISPTAIRTRMRAQGMDSQGERRVQGQMTDREMIQQQKRDREALEQSDDPIDKKIAMLQRQLDALYRQKEAQQRREETMQ